MISALPATRPESDLIEECRRRSLKLLRGNTTPHGLLAAAPSPQAKGRGYASIFGRDAAICVLGLAVCGDPELAAAARRSLLTLAEHQAANGQIPKFVRPEAAEVDFWYAGCIDATLWWLIALHHHDRHLPGQALAPELQPRVERALNWLLCQEHQGWRLLQQNEASDWADIMPRSGFVLYTNVLWYWVKRLYDLSHRETTREYFHHLFFPFGPAFPGHRRARLLAHYIRQQARPSEFFLSFVNFSFWGKEIDLFGNLLAPLAGVTGASRGVAIVEGIARLGADRPYPLRAVGIPLEKDDPLWRPYMERHRQNLPYQYHNGGCWPFIGGFQVLLLARLGRTREAWEALENLAAANRVGDWQFNEWFHGRSGEALGIPGQSWNAALFLLAFEALAAGTRLLP